jgi:inner membrane protein
LVCGVDRLYLRSDDLWVATGWVGFASLVFRGRGWAVAGLVGVCGLWMLRAVEHGKAVDVAMAQSVKAPVEVRLGGLDAPLGSEANAANEPAPVYLGAQRVLATPDPLSPFRWSTVTDFGPLYQLAEVDTRNGALTPGETTFPKPGRDADVLAAERSRLGRVFIDWSPMPIVDVSKPGSELEAEGSGDPEAADRETVVTFRDPRFMGGWMAGSGRTALEGAVTLDAAGHVVRETMGGRAEPRR